MRTFGIISEFNPFHNGHKRIVDAAREQGADAIVTVMSGNAVQRGELAAFDKYLRAESAVRCGADLVLELPFPWCSASAEYFATCAVKILSDICTDIIFGSECGDIDVLSRAADIASDEEFCKEYRTRLEQGERAAFAYASMLQKRGIQSLSSNDLLGVEYIKAVKKVDLDIKMHTIKREGSDYNCKTLEENTCPSATALRNALRENADISSYVPSGTLESLRNAVNNGEMFDISNISGAIITYFRLSDPQDFSNIADTDGGIANRICTLARSTSNIEELLDGLKTKRYTDAKLRRALMFCLTGVTKELLMSDPQYTTLLGANAKGRELLSDLRKKDVKTEVVTKPADAPKNSEQYKASDKLEALFVAGLKKPMTLDDAYRKKAFMYEL